MNIRRCYATITRSREPLLMTRHIQKLAAMAVMASFWAAEAMAMERAGRHIPPGGGSVGGGSAPEIDGPAGLTAVALVACIGLYLYNRYRR